MSSKRRLKWLCELNGWEDYPFKYMEKDIVYCKICEELKIKLDNVLKKNPGFERIKTITGVISGTTSTLPEGMGPGDVAMFMYCPTASVGVERSFSMYKNILSDKRQKLTKETLKKIMLCHCYYNRE